MKKKIDEVCAKTTNFV